MNNTAAVTFLFYNNKSQYYINTEYSNNMNSSNENVIIRKKKKDVDKLINKLFDILNKISDKECCYLITVRTTNLSDELLETLKIIKGCINCKDDNLGKRNLDEFRKSINKIENYLAE